jgi:hypothetical protein
MDFATESARVVCVKFLSFKILDRKSIALEAFFFLFLEYLFFVLELDINYISHL